MMGGVEETRRLRERMTVSRVVAGQATVEGHGAQTCGSCAVSSGCAAAQLVQLVAARKAVAVQGQKISLDALSLPVPEGVSAGDELDVSVPADRLLGAAALAWLLPAAVLVAAASALAGLGLADWLVALICVPLFALSLWPLRRAELRGMGLRIDAVLPRRSEGDA